MRIPIINRFTCNERQLKFMIKSILNKKMFPILDFANENSIDFENNFKKIKNLVENYPNNYISVKLSSLNFKQDYLEDITKLAIKNNSKILIDAENFSVQDKIEEISNNLIKSYNTNQVNIYKTYQMYRTDSLNLLKNDFLQTRDYYIGCKLVRGAYYNKDKKYNILFRKIKDTHNNYDEAVKFLSEYKKENDVIMCATHNIKSIDKVINLINNKKIKNIEFAHLLGMSDILSEKLSNNYKVYKYLPFGNYNDTLPYLIRRLYENYPLLMYISK